MLKKFYKDIAAAIESDTPPEWFYSDYGLCKNLESWCNCEGLHSFHLHQKMADQFVEAGLSYCFPFYGSYDDYKNEHMLNTVYKNPARLAWIKEHAK